MCSDGTNGWLRLTNGAGPSVGTGTSQTLAYSVASNRHQDARTSTITVLDEAGLPTSAVVTLTQVNGQTCP